MPATTSRPRYLPGAGCAERVDLAQERPVAARAAGFRTTGAGRIDRRGLARRGLCASRARPLRRRPLAIARIDAESAGFWLAALRASAAAFSSAPPGSGCAEVSGMVALERTDPSPRRWPPAHRSLGGFDGVGEGRPVGIGDRLAPPSAPLSILALRARVCCRSSAHPAWRLLVLGSRSCACDPQLRWCGPRAPLPLLVVELRWRLPIVPPGAIARR